MVQSKRFRGKINVQKPRKPHYQRALFEAVTQPRYPRVTAVDLCQQKLEMKQLHLELDIKKELHPYEAILTRELFEYFDKAQMILIGQKNSIDEYEFFKFRVECHKRKVKTCIYNRKIIKNAIQDTRFHAMLPLLLQTPYSCMLFGQEWNVGSLLKVFKKTPKVLLLAGSLGNRYMSRAQLEHFASLPDLTTVRAQFVATLNSVGGQLANNLQSHQGNLCQLLASHADILKTNANPLKEEPSTAPSNEKTES